MIEIIFPNNCQISTEEKWHTIFKFMKENKEAVVDFKNVNGEFRSMPCTTNPELMPFSEIVHHHKTKVIDYNTMHVWCTDKAAWRAFKTEKVTAIRTET
jgi:hypothetical protein